MVTNVKCQQPLDYIRENNTKESSIRIMTLLSSKGLDADHVYIIGCNDGNIPGQNKSAYLTDHEHKQEQRRLLFVGVTRAKKTVTISWSRHIPYAESQQNNTASIGISKKNGKTMSKVGLSEFLVSINFNLPS